MATDAFIRATVNSIFDISLRTSGKHASTRSSRFSTLSSSSSRDPCRRSCVASWRVALNANASLVAFRSASSLDSRFSRSTAALSRYSTPFIRFSRRAIRCARYLRDDSSCSSSCASRSVTTVVITFVRRRSPFSLLSSPSNATRCEKKPTHRYYNTHNIYYIIYWSSCCSVRMSGKLLLLKNTQSGLKKKTM